MHTCKEHLNTKLGISHYEHHVWSADSWTKHIHTHHPDFPLFMEMKLECAMPEESEEVLAVLTASQNPSEAPITST